MSSVAITEAGKYPSIPLRSGYFYTTKLHSGTEWKWLKLSPLAETKNCNQVEWPNPRSQRCQQ